MTSDVFRFGRADIFTPLRHGRFSTARSMIVFRLGPDAIMRDVGDGALTQTSEKVEVAVGAGPFKDRFVGALPCLKIKAREIN
jgi:hypothetical protein